MYGLMIFILYLQTSFSDLSGFVSAYHEYVVYVETLTSYLQLRCDA